ncbi:craniofacial development protein 2-like [Culex pipiens pallens]|uniref:craniofacial development protein 2-like n=1 Tax=Culex pipiens pallens TaxID=42434 RepID=UPI001954B809|nr:craniofacial development protein 2-like [Culex pipiens pallens]
MWEADALEVTMYQSKLGTGFIVLGKMRSRVIDWEPIDDRMCRLRIKGRFFNYLIFNVHCPHEESSDAVKETFYAKLEQKFGSCLQRDVKIVIGDMNARIGREEMYKPVIGPNSLHTVTNDNDQRCIYFAASRD